MATDWRKTALWVIAVLFAAVFAGWAVISRGGDAPAQAARGMGGPPAALASAAPASAAVADAQPACKDSPLLARKAQDDGQERLQARPADASADEVASLIRTGKEAAASGRQRDAEVSFLNACRNAAQLHGEDTIALSDAMYQLARLYANAAALGAKKPQELYERAAMLYEASLVAYTARYGPGHEKTKFAQQGLETVRVALGPAAQAAPAPQPAPAPAPAAPVASAAASEPLAEPVQEAKAPEPVREAKAPEPVQEAKAPEPVQEAKASEPVQRAEAPPPKKRAPKPKPEPEPEPEAVEPPPGPMAMEPPAPEAPPPPAAAMGAQPGADIGTAEGSASAEPQ